MHAIDNQLPRRVPRAAHAFAPTLAGALLAICLLSPSTLAQSQPTPVDVATLTKQADTLFAASKFDEALAKLDEIASTYGDKVPAELAYNRARTLAAMQRVGEAETIFKSVLARASDPVVKAAAAANLGSIEAARAMPEEGKLPLDQAVDTLRRAERYFRIANAAHPGDGSSAANIDLIQRRIAAMQEEQKKQDGEKSEQKQDKKDENSENKEGDSSKSDSHGDKSEDQQKKDQKSNSLADELSDLANKQQQEADQTKDLSKQSQQSGDVQAKQGQQAKDQQDLRERTEKAKQQADAKADSSSDKNQPGNEMQQAQQKLDEARKAQQQAEQDLKSGKPQQAQEQQQKAADALRQAAEHAKASEPSKEPQPSQDQQQAQQPAQAANKPYDATAAQILDRERAIRDRLRQIQMQRSRLVPVEKDW